MTDIVSRLKRALGTGFFIEPSNERHEMVDIIRKGYFSDHPPRNELEALIKDVLPGVDFELKESHKDEEYFTGTGPDLRLAFTPLAPQEYWHHTFIFANNSHVHIMLTRRGMYPSIAQQKAYAQLIKETFSRFYQPPALS